MPRKAKLAQTKSTIYWYCSAGTGERLYTTYEAAQILGTTLKEIYVLIKRGELPFAKYQPEAGFFTPYLIREDLLLFIKKQRSREGQEARDEQGARGGQGARGERQKSRHGREPPTRPKTKAPRTIG